MIELSNVEVLENSIVLFFEPQVRPVTRRYEDSSEAPVGTKPTLWRHTLPPPLGPLPHTVN